MHEKYYSAPPTIPGMEGIDSFNIIDTSKSHHILCTVHYLTRSVSSVGVQHDNRVKLEML